MDNEPFSGVNGRTSIFDWWKVASLQHLYAELHGNPVLTESERGILRRYVDALRLAQYPAFREGKTFDLGYCQPDGFDRGSLFAFLRCDGEECFLVVANFAPAPCSGEIVIPDEAFVYLGLEKKSSSCRFSVGASDYVAMTL